MGLGRKSNTKLARKILAIFGFAVCFPLLAGVGCRLGKGLREEKLSSKLPWLVHFLYFLFSVCSGAKPAIRGTEELVSSNVPPISFLLSYFCTF